MTSTVTRPPERGYATTALGQIHYARMGEGPPLVLLAVAGRSYRMFTGLMAVLAERYRTIAIDMPGVGASDPLPLGTSMEAVGDAFFAVLDAIGVERVALYGMHSGNKIATAMAGAQPQRIRKLVLCGQTHSLIPDQTRRNAVITGHIRGEVTLPSDPRPVQHSPKLDSLMEMMRRLGQDAEHSRHGGSLRDHLIDEAQARGTAALYAANFAYDLERGFAAIRCPTLVIEVATPAETVELGRQGQAVVDRIAGSRLVTIEEPDGSALTLENRTKDLAGILVEFLGKAA